MQKRIKTFVIWEWVALVIGIGGALFGFISCVNWESHKAIPLEFPVNLSEKTSSYYAVNSDSLEVCQQKGKSSCRYTVYYAKRGGSFTKVAEGLTFSSNDTMSYKPFSLSSTWWNDVRFKVKKTAGHNVASTLLLSLGKEK